MKKAIFLTGSMGSGKSTILERTDFIEQVGYVRRCTDYDILGVSQCGADRLSNYKKVDVLKSLEAYSGEKLLIAGEYYSKNVDLQRFKDLGFKIYVILLHVDRDIIYSRLMHRGGGRWNELTYKTNMNARVSFFKAHKGNKKIMKNNTLEQQAEIIQVIKDI